MRLDRPPVRAMMGKRPDLVMGLLIFVTCLFVYLGNGDLFIGSSDNIPNSLLAFNWLENHSLNFNIFEDGKLFVEGEAPYYFARGLNGDLTSRYPIGTAIITFPLYVVFFLYLKLSNLIHGITTGTPIEALDIASRNFESYRIAFSKLSGAIITAFSAVLFYFILRLKFNTGTSLISTFIFAFCTASWALNAQDLRQHTVSNLVLITIVLCLMKADRTQGKKRKIVLFLAGIFCGLLPSVRVTSGIFSLAAFLYTLYAFRKEAVYFLLGLPSVILHFAWNAYYFGFDNLISGGYVEQFENRESSYKFTLEQLAASVPGLLFSPSEGLFVYSPVLLFAIPGAGQVFRLRRQRDETLFIFLTIAALGLFINYSFYGSWTGGSDSYGCRFLTDILPIVCLLVAYFLDSLMQGLEQSRTQAKIKVTQAILTIFLISSLVSTSIQAIGSYTNTDWGVSPIPVLTNRGRLWSTTDSQIERHFRNLLARITEPIQEPKPYVLGLDGVVEKIEILTRDGEVTDATHGVELFSKQRRIVRATLKNTGQSQWFGYQTGMMNQGETKLRIYFIGEDGVKARPREGKWLNISDTPKTGEQTQALARVMFPKKPGRYQMTFDLFALGLNNSYTKSKPPIGAVNVTILPRD